MTPTDEETKFSWIDTHCHLHLLDDPETAHAAALQTGVTGMVTVGIDLASDALSIDLARRFEKVVAAVGLHPHDATDLTPATLAALEQMTTSAGVVAVGETGLDYYRDLSPRQDQAEAFRKQISLAKESDRTLIVHMRDAHEDVFRILREEGPPVRLVFHCFSGGAVEARSALDLGGYLSFAGNISYPSAAELREAAASAPLDRVLVETDSPFLAPVPKRGRPNEPGFVGLVGAALAAAIGRELGEVAEATSSNARAAFRLGF